MPDKTLGLLHRIEDAERALDKAIADWRREAATHARATAAAFSDQIRAEHQALRRSLLAHLRSIGLLFWLTAPFIYAMIIPIMLTDLFATVYQHVCFRVYGIPRLRRADYVVIDRHRLGYLNALEKLNCLYCSYANGVLAYTRELASRTEQYFCPIKHAIPVAGPHARYASFLDYGDAKGYREQAERFRNSAGEPIP